MQLRFLLGPAGSGKTARCLAGVRTELLRAPDGPPLILLAPKQATFQLERQLLADPALRGYTRLQILSFERLAQYVLNQLGVATPVSLSEEGRVMVLRALLIRHQADLKIFRAAARLTGFAQQLSLILREFHQHHLAPAKLDHLAADKETPPQLRDKLHDLALLSRAYNDWLTNHQLRDGNSLLNTATDALRSQSAIGNRQSAISALWLDGFAEMTPQELDLLTALVPRCEAATLAFCLASQPEGQVPWLSPWSVVASTFQNVYAKLEALDDCQITVEQLKNTPGHGRFAHNEALRHLESNWTQVPKSSHPLSSAPSGGEGRGEEVLSKLSTTTRRPNSPQSAIGNRQSAILPTVCSSPETEATLAAREILKHVQTGGRYRDCAVIVRTLDHCHATVARVFRRYDIPFFMDRREPVNHHPLTELTRFALRTVTFGWRHDDWFGALKTGLVPAEEHQIDQLENEALANGWVGHAWHKPLTIGENQPAAEHIEKLRRRLLPPFEKLSTALTVQPTGTQLVTAIRDFWTALRVEETLESWTLAATEQSATGNRQSAIHSTVVEQMHLWLDNLALAFSADALPLREWLPVLEAGLVNLTVGVIPPALDQVLIGAVDRSRNPDLKLAIILGLNEGIFPAPPTPGTLLTDADRNALEGQNVYLGPTLYQRLGHERYLGYIACTRPSERLVLTCAARDEEGQPLNPSPFFNHVQQITGIKAETFNDPDWWQSLHPTELAAPVLRAHAITSTTSANDQLLGSFSGSPSPVRRERAGVRVSPLVTLGDLPALAPLVQKWHHLQSAAKTPPLPPEVLARIYGTDLRASVSALEEFAACPFKFFAARGLRLAERKEYQFDDRDKGSFQHEILEILHDRIRDSKREWREVPVTEMRAMIADIGREQLTRYGGGRFLADGASQFTGELLIERLQQLMTVVLEWMPQYDFNPKEVEISFGMEGEERAFPAWKLALPGGHSLLLRGRIDRVDLCRTSEETALAVVMDYKSSVRSLNPTKLHHGLELQLLSYLGVLRHLSNPQEFLGVKNLIPAGVFYVPLNGGQGGFTASREDALHGGDENRRAAYQHSGRFLAEDLSHFDNRNVSKGDQFKYSRNKDGALSARANDAVLRAEFEALREKVEAHLRDYGRRIFAGEVTVSPYRIGHEAACDRCDFRPVCRFDPWTQPYRQLRPPPKPQKELPAGTPNVGKPKPK